MPDGARPGRRVFRVATKEVLHGDPAVEAHAAGIAKKAEQSAGGVPNAANATVVRTIHVGDDCVIFLDGILPVRDALLPGGAAVGDPLWIRIADNVLVNAAEALTGGVMEAAYDKFGRVESLDDPSSAVCSLVNLGARDSF